MSKVYILDTNVILSDAESIFNFDEHHVIIPITVIEELDKFKKDKSELGANARAFSRHMDFLRKYGNLTIFDGIKFKTDYDEIVRNISVFMWEEVVHKAQNYIHSDFTAMDDRILAVACYLTQVYSIGTNTKEVIFVTNDINLRIRADIYGVKAEEYKHNRISRNDLYSGIEIQESTQEVVDSIYEKKSLSYLEVLDEEPYSNKCFIIKAGKQSALCRYNSSKKVLKLIHQDLKTCGIIPKSVEQQFALELLRNNEIPLVTMIGKAGTGKSLLALASGLRSVMEFQDYEKILLLKPIVSMDNSNQLGYLPGSMSDKLEPWMASYADNINVLMKAYFKQDEEDTPKKTRSSKASKQAATDDKSKAKLNPVAELMELGMLEFGSLEHMRGRSLTKTYIIIDECLTYDQKILFSDNSCATIFDIVENWNEYSKKEIVTVNENTGNIELNLIDNIVVKDCNEDVYEILLDDGQVLKLTENHQLFVNGLGYIKVKDMKPNMQLKSLDSISKNY